MFLRRIWSVVRKVVCLATALVPERSWEEPWEAPHWDEFDSIDDHGHSMKRSGPCEWTCVRCGAQTTFRHCISPLPDDWGVYSPVDGEARDCDEEVAMVVLNS